MKKDSDLVEKYMLPASREQAALWFINQLKKNSSAYNIAGVVEFDGFLNVDALKSSIDVIVDKHEALRTHMEYVDEEVFQIVCSKVQVSVDIIQIDTYKDNDESVELKWAELLKRESVRIFNLEEAPLIHFTLVRFDTNKYRLIIVMHHIITDGWSIKILVDDLMKVYSSRLSEEVKILKKLDIQFADYAAWQKENFTKNKYDEHISYWKNKFKEPVELPDLIKDNEKKITESEEAAYYETTIDTEFHTQLIKYCKENQITLYMLMMSCFGLLISKYARSKDFVIGTPVANRPFRELEEVIGYFVNTLPIRFHIDAKMSIKEYLQQMKTEIASCFSHQELPFSEIVATTAINRRLVENPLFNIMFSLQNMPKSVLQLPDLEVKSYGINLQHTKFDMSLFVDEDVNNLKITLEYKKELWYAETIASLIDGYKKILKEIISKSKSFLHEIEIIEKETYINYTKQQECKETDLIEKVILKRFEANVKLNPDKICIEDKGVALNYLEVKNKSDQIATFLMNEKVKIEDLVGIYMERSADFLVSLLAIIKVGGCAVLLDRGLPEQRVSKLLKTDKIPYLLTDKQFDFDYEGKTIFIADMKQVALDITKFPKVSPEHSLYMIYTSGSTGLPKGVLVSQRQYLNYINSVEDAFITPFEGEYVLLHSSISFDLTLTSIFLPLVSNLTIVVQREDDALLLSKNLMSGYRFRFIKLTPAHLDILNQSETDWYQNVSCLVVGGEKLYYHHIEKIKNPQMIIYNEYGPTECTVGCALEKLKFPFKKEEISIGYQNPNVSFYVVDDYGHILPYGFPGELYIGGKCVTYGYYNRPSLTARSFVPDDFSGSSGGRLYRTGDICRFRHDGKLDYIGRQDDQIKIRGYRIETGEIENIIKKYPDIKAVCVVINKKQEQLICYYVTQNELSLEDFCRKLKEELPAYMIPNLYVRLESLPLTANGKLDKKKLPVPELGANIEYGKYKEAETQTEKILSGIFREILQINQISVDGNFFDYGGHSLLAMKVISRIKEKFMVQLELKDFFNTPKISDLSKIIDIRKESVHPRTKLIPNPDSNPAIASFEQEQLYILKQIDENSYSYNIPACIEFSGDFDIEIIKKAWTKVVERHEILRTQFFVKNGVAYQTVLEAIKLPLDFINMEKQNNQEELWDILFKKEICRIFNLEQAPLFRVIIVRMTADIYRMLFVIHHIIFDGWSEHIIIRDFLEYYKSFKIKDYKINMQPLTIQYRDYAIWQRNMFEKGHFTSQLEYWVNKFKNKVKTLELPLDYSKELNKKSVGLHYTKELRTETVVKLKQFAFESGSTIFSVMLSCFGIMLHRYTGSEELVVGVPVAGRKDILLENLIGYFVNTIAILLDCSGNPTFREYLEGNKKDILDSMNNQEIPFEKVVQAVSPERTLNQNPLFQVMFVLQNTPVTKLELPEISIRQIKIESHTTKFDLMLIVEEIEGKIFANFEYDSALFKNETIIRMYEIYEEIINNVIDNSDEVINCLSILPHKQYKQFIKEWGSSNKDFPSSKTFSQLFQKNVIKFGDNLAAEDEGRKVTYKDLWNETLRIAYWLMYSGVTRGGILPILMDRSCSFLSSIIGTFHVGAAYVPIDPVYPIERIKNILEQTNGRIILTERKFAHIFEKINSTDKVLLYYDELPEYNDIDIDKVILSIDSGNPRDLSYIIFTSGSTGTPKGAMVEQRGMINHLYSKINDLDIKIDKVIQNASQSFDISVWQNLVCLLTGGSVCIANQEISSNPLKLFQYQEEKSATLLEVVPSFLRIALETDLKFSIKKLKWILVTGEALPADLCREWYKKYGAVKLVNAYGPTECSDDVTHYVIPNDLSVQLISAPIGKAVNNTQIYILDKDLNVLPEGVAGELCVGGVGVGRGYYKTPKLTASAFLPDPYSKIPNARLYRTGDLCRSIGNGVYQFISRMDYQVKIRGYRIELGEIEHVIKQIDEIRDCIVWTYGDLPHVRLVAYYIAEQDIEKDRIIAYISDKLPGYMIPSIFIKIQSIPVTVNGKVDYKSLPIIEQDSVDSYVAPNSQLEFEIAEIMSKVLNLEKMSVTANFFDMGGNSLTAIQAINKLNQQRKSSVSIKTLFEKPTVRELSISIEKEQEHDKQVVELRKIDRSKRIPVSFGQQQLLLFKKLSPDDTSYNISGALDLIGNLDVERLLDALTKIIERHEILRTVFVEEEGIFYQDIKGFVKIPFVFLEDNTSWEDLVLKESKRIFDFNEGPLFNLNLIKLDKNHYRLMIVMHHIISDGWSISVLIKEISNFYKNINSSEKLPLLEFQYADYADWHQRLLASGVLDKQLNYWVEKLGNYKDILDLPVDYNRQSGQPAKGKVISYQFEFINKKIIETICEENGITPYVFLLSAFGVLLQKYSGMPEVVVGSPVLGRKNSFLDDLLGYFVNTITIKLDGKDNPSFKDYLARVKLDVIDSLNNQDIPFEKVVEALHPSRNLQQNPLFQVMFGFQNISMGVIDFPEVEVTSMQIHNGTAKFDLMFMIEETKGEYCTNIEFDSNIFSVDTIDNMFDCYKTIIKEVYNDQTKKLSEINIVSNKSKQLMLDVWNRRELEFPTNQTFSQLFRKSSYSYKNELCASDADCNLTYSQVWDMSCKVADRLILEGISPGEPVVVFMERSTKFLITIIGIFHARAAYVPIDPNYPEYRIKQIIDKSKSGLMITERALNNSIDYFGNYISAIYIDDILENSVLNESEVKVVERRIDTGRKTDLAYIIFTSGSTGEPKGVMIEQGGMINHLYAKINDFKIEKDVIIQNSSQCFDISVWQNLVCLLTGGTVHIVSQEVSMDPKRLFSTVYSLNATILEIVPSMLRAALEAEAYIMTSKLKYLVVTGEMLPNDICESWYNFHSEIPIINAYGPTECSDDVTHYIVSNEVKNEPIPLPIGTPINNLKLYILNSFLMPVPIGVKGELYVGGIGVGRGYINNPRETAKAFIPNPYAVTSSERLYKTGDSCRYLSDGRIQYLGRIDQQVKIRGFRIELLEIEITIRKYENIEDCVVIPNAINNQNRLICYYVAAEGLEQSLIKKWLLRLLPSYMVPSLFIWLDKLPLTPNGKIDRHSLPEPIINMDELNVEYIAPITDIERKVAEMMADILGIKRVGLYNNFFDLGGHSLLVNKLVMEVEKEYDCKISFKDIFEEPTVANVSDRINEYMSKKDELIKVIATLEESQVSELLERMDKEDIDKILEELRFNYSI